MVYWKQIFSSIRGPFRSPGQDSCIVKDLKDHFKHKYRPCHYGGYRYEVDSFVLEAAPGVVETMVTDLASLIKNKPSRLLNLGGGLGQLSSMFEYLGFKVTNVDIAIEHQDEINIKADFNMVDSLPLPEKSFNVIVCQEVIEHIENPWQLVRLSKKYIDDGGILYLTTPNIHSKRSKKCFIRTNYFKWFEEKNLSYHINPLPFWEIRQIAEKSGYEPVSILGSGDYFFSRDNRHEQKKFMNNDILIWKFRPRA